MNKVTAWIETQEATGFTVLDWKHNWKAPYDVEKKEGYFLTEGQIKTLIGNGFYRGCQWFNGSDTDFTKAQDDCINDLLK